MHNLHPEDVPAETGFVVFAEPIGAYLPEPLAGTPTDVGADAAGVVTIVAALWDRWTESSSPWALTPFD